MKRRTSGWSFRLMKQGEVSESAHFVTLTYDTNKVPISENGFMTLQKTDLQKYFKRLRKLNPDAQIKYYACGEYGGRTMRPHYHIILFNADIHHIEEAWSLDKKMLGYIHIGSVSDASIGYTLKYMSKGSKIPQHINDDRQKEFALMSKGLGKNYLSSQMIQYHKNDIVNRMFVNLKGGKKASMPRYFKEKIYNDEEKRLISEAMEEKQLIQEMETIEKLGELYAKTVVERHELAFEKMYKISNEKRNINWKNDNV
jgi:hypothetical protein